MAIDAEVWEAMCEPVRVRYRAHRAHAWRELVTRALEWEARRRKTPVGHALRVDARILVVQPDHLGGVLASTPAFRVIKESLPTSEVVVLAGPWGADAAEHCPAVDRVRQCRFPAFDRSARAAGAIQGAVGRLAPYERLLATAGELRSERFDAALVLIPDMWSAAATALAGIPVRLGFSGGEAERFLSGAEHVATPGLGKGPSEPGVEHVAASQLRLARRLVAMTGRPAVDRFDGRMAYEPTHAERAESARLWRAHDLDEAPAVVVIHPAPGGPSKRWPAARFAILADHIAGRLGARVVFTGGPGDVEEVRAITARCAHRPIELAGQTSFGALAALLERARFAFGTDNGAMHLATARGVPSLRLFGPTDPRVWSGWAGEAPAGPIVRSLASPRRCSPCHRLDVPAWKAIPGTRGDAYPCMDEVSTEMAIDAVERLWKDIHSRVG